MRDPHAFTPMLEEGVGGAPPRSLTLGSDLAMNQREIGKFSQKDAKVRKVSVTSSMFDSPPLSSHSLCQRCPTLFFVLLPGLPRFCGVPREVSRCYPASSGRSSCRCCRSDDWITEEEAGCCQNSEAYCQMWCVWKKNSLGNACFWKKHFLLLSYSGLFFNLKVWNLAQTSQTFMRL